MLNKNKLSITDTDRIIDNHIESETDILFVCNYPLAKYICEYLADDYDIVDETMELNDNVEEYYVSLLFDGEEIQMFCEDARGNNGDYKYCDFCDDYGDYFIFTDMSEEIADVTLEGNASWSWCELIEDDEVFECQCDDCVEQRRLDALDEQEEMCSQCDGCDCCNNDEEELADWQKQIVDIIEDFAFKIEHEIENDDLCECGCTLRNMLADLFYQARQIGFEDGVECGVESVEEKTVNIHVDNLTLNNVANSKDFVEQLKNLSRISNVQSR